MANPKVFDVFAGAGGFSLGFQMAGCDIIGVIKHDKFSHVETVCCLYHQKKDFISVLYEPKDGSYLKQLK